MWILTGRESGKCATRHEAAVAQTRKIVTLMEGVCEAQHSGRGRKRMDCQGCMLQLHQELERARD